MNQTYVPKFIALLPRYLLVVPIALTLWLSLTTIRPEVRAASLTASGQLPLQLATEASQEAVNDCRRSGYAVTATIVNVAGQRQVVLRDDEAPPHTLDNSFNKAYTVVTLGKVYQKDTTTELGEILLNKPTTPFLATLPGINLGSGGVAIKSGDRLLAGLGVSGAPGGNFDEACAKAAAIEIQKRLPR